ncbi:hypothetical protein CALVIDRAFT_569440 [Calocera viscosa TUFC12733]|uniref:Protein kinase domain-containing protein n=1 Tax=Calocera viscosa (strain TUFC12733) TaxID=1330018 RepID=A0A167FZP0_CALVF|nr:hypothetical protein CALVIDRAFT_569440 [Calocera viscosa TUFC12733]
MLSAMPSYQVTLFDASDTRPPEAPKARRPRTRADGLIGASGLTRPTTQLEMSLPDEYQMKAMAILNTPTGLYELAHEFIERSQKRLLRGDPTRLAELLPWWQAVSEMIDPAERFEDGDSEAMREQSVTRRLVIPGTQVINSLLGGDPVVQWSVQVTVRFSPPLTNTIELVKGAEDDAEADDLDSLDENMVDTQEQDELPKAKKSYLIILDQRTRIKFRVEKAGTSEVVSVTVAVGELKKDVILAKQAEGHMKLAESSIPFDLGNGSSATVHVHEWPIGEAERSAPGRGKRYRFSNGTENTMSLIGAINTQTYTNLLAAGTSVGYWASGRLPVPFALVGRTLVTLGRYEGNKMQIAWIGNFLYGLVAQRGSYPGAWDCIPGEDREDLLNIFCPFIELVERCGSLDASTSSSTGRIDSSGPTNPGAVPSSVATKYDNSGTRKPAKGAQTPLRSVTGRRSMSSFAAPKPAIHYPVMAGDRLLHIEYYDSLDFPRELQFEGVWPGALSPRSHVLSIPGRPIHRGNTAAIFRGSLRRDAADVDYLRVIAKIASNEDAAAALQNEVAAYERLEPIWGREVVKPLGFYRYSVDDRMYAVLLLQDAGASLKNMPSRDAIYRLIKPVHKCNVMHHALEPHHFAADDEGKMRLLDFSQSTRHPVGECNGHCYELDRVAPIADPYGVYAAKERDTDFDQSI